MDVSQTKEQLIQEYSEYAVRIAKQIKRTLSPKVDLEDLMSYAMMGLVESAERFDPRHGAHFSTYSYYRIRGAIYDGLRAMGWMNRSTYKRQKFEERASMYLENEAMRKLSSKEENHSSSHALEQIAQKVQRLATIYIASLEDSDVQSLSDPNIEAFDEALARMQLCEQLRLALRKLPTNDQAIIQGYYFEELSLEEVGKRLGLSKSWTSRKHARAIEKLSDHFFAQIGEKKEAKSFSSPKGTSERASV